MSRCNSAQQTKYGLIMITITNILIATLIVVASHIPIFSVRALNPPITGEEEVDKWSKYFYSELLKRDIRVVYGVTIKLVYGYDFGNPNVIGKCFYIDNSIILDAGWFYEQPSCLQGMLVIHELGHCSLRLHHSERGIMRPTVPSSCEEGDTEILTDTLLDEVIRGN